MPLHRQLLDRIARDAARPASAPAPLNVCPHCGSPFVQPLCWERLPGGVIQLELRCPECEAWMAGTFSAERVAALDEALQAGRADLALLYERMVRNALHEEADRLAEALARDLVGPEDFRPAH